MLSLVIPVYMNEASIPALLSAVEGIAAAVEDGLEATFVVDGSPDGSYTALRDSLPSRAYRSRLVRLSRNFGAFAAIRAGLEVGRGDRYAVMAADLQEPPELVLRMDEVLRGGGADVVLGRREGREDPIGTRIPATTFWAFYRRLVLRDVPAGGVDIFACTREFRNHLLDLREHRSSLIAQVFWLGYRREYVGYTRAPRREGSSAWSVRRRLGYLSDNVFAFTDLPIRLLTWVGGLTLLVASVYGLLVALMRLFGSIEVPGFTVIVLAIVFFGSLNTFALGIVGSYAWRAYENSKARPLHVVQEIEDFGPEVADG
jgi:glycosyltransferase involved in cell wall biosynthesis